MLLIFLKMNNLKEPVSYLKSLGRKITLEDLYKIRDYMYDILVTNQQPFQKVVDDFLETDNAFLNLMRRNNKINKRIEEYMKSVVFSFKDKFYFIFDVEFKPFSKKISLGKGINVLSIIKFKECVLDENGKYELLDLFFVKRKYRAIGKPIKIEKELFPAVVGSNQTSGIYNMNIGGGWITSTASNSNYPIPARLKLSIVVGEGSPVLVRDKHNKKQLQSELKITINEGTSKMTLLKIVNPKRLMAWESKNVYYFILKEYVFNKELSKNLKFNIFVILGFVRYVMKTPLKDIDKVSLKFPVEDLDHVIDMYDKFKESLLETIKDARSNVKDGFVYLKYPFLQYISFDTNQRIPDINTKIDVKDGVLNIDSRNDIPTLKNTFAKTPFDYIFRYLTNKNIDEIGLSQIFNNIKQMFDMLLFKIHGIDYDDRFSDDRDHWLNRRIETVDDKLVKRFQQELNRSIREIYKEQRNKTFKDAFEILTSDMRSNISVITKGKHAKVTDGSSKESGYYIDKGLSARNEVGTYGVEVSVESNADTTTSMTLRILHPSGHPFIDSGHTKSDTSIGGLIRHMSSLTRITEDSDMYSEIKKIKKILKSGNTKVFFNNVFLGSFRNPLERLLKAKRIWYINRDLAIYTRNDDVIIQSFNGVPTRPCIHLPTLESTIDNLTKNGSKVDLTSIMMNLKSDFFIKIRNDIEKELGLQKSKTIDYKYSGLFEWVNVYDQNVRLLSKTIWTSYNEYINNKSRNDFDVVNSDYSELGPEVMNSTCTLSLPYFNYIEGTRTIYYATQDKHKLERHINSVPIAPDNYYAMFATLPLLRTKAWDVYGSKEVGFLATVSSGSYHGYEQEDHYIVNEKSMFKIGYKHIKNFSIEYTKNFKKNSGLGFANPSSYKNSRKLEYEMWLEDNGITSERYNMKTYPIHIKNGVDLEYGDILVVLHEANETKIGSVSKKFRGYKGKILDLVVENRNKRSIETGYIRYKIEEYYDGHPTQKLTTNHAQKATIGPAAKHLKIYMIKKGEYIESDISMSMENVISRGTPGLILEGFLNPILLHLGLSLSIPAYAKTLDIKDLIKKLDWWKPVKTYIPVNNFDGRPRFVESDNKEYPMMLHFYVLSQDGVSKGSVSNFRSRRNETSGDVKKGGAHGGLSIGRMDLNGLSAVNNPRDLLDVIYHDENAVKEIHIPICKRCDSKGYIKSYKNERGFSIICTECDNKEHLRYGNTSIRFNSIKYRNHVHNTDTLMEMFGIRKKFKLE